jgi:hypothetical protein
MENLISLQEYRNILIQIIEEKLSYTYHYCTVDASVSYDGKLRCKTYISSKLNSNIIGSEEFKFNCEANSFDEIIHRLKQEIDWKKTQWKETQIYVKDNTNT